MSEGDIWARHYTTGQCVHLRWHAGRITGMEPGPERSGIVQWLAPTLVDLQINGYGGVDFQRDDLAPGDLLSATQQLRRDGCGQYLLTLITDDWTSLMQRLSQLKRLRDELPELRRAIVGWHVEGPFISAQPGFCGAHNPAVMEDPRPEHIRELRAVTGNDPVLLTLAPERAGALEAITLAVSLGITVSLGHTNASAAVLASAVQAGATGFTHLGNALPQQLDRHDNLLWRVLDTPGLTASLIPDTLHVSPMFFRLVHRLLPPERIYYTTDAMSAAGAPPGRYTIGQIELEVGSDQIVRLPGKSNFAGSALRPIEGVFRAAAMLGCPWQRTWDYFAQQPARLINLANELAVGAPADFCLLQITDEQQLAGFSVHIEGEIINQANRMTVIRPAQPTHQ